MVAKLSQFRCSNLGLVPEDCVQGTDVSHFPPFVFCVFRCLDLIRGEKEREEERERERRRRGRGREKDREREFW